MSIRISRAPFWHPCDISTFVLYTTYTLLPLPEERHWSPPFWSCCSRLLIPPLDSQCRCGLAEMTCLRWPTRAFTSETDLSALLRNMENGIILLSWKWHGWSSSGLREARKAAQVWRKTVKRPKCLQMAAQGQVEGAGLGRWWGRFAVNQKTTWPDGAELAWAGVACVQAQSRRARAKPYSSVWQVWGCCRERTWGVQMVQTIHVCGETREGFWGISLQHPSWSTPGQPQMTHTFRQWSLSARRGERLLDRRTNLAGLTAGQSCVLSGMRTCYLQGGWLSKSHFPVGAGQLNGLASSPMLVGNAMWVIT